jgi:hypothetical protein
MNAALFGVAATLFSLGASMVTVAIILRRDPDTSREDRASASTFGGAGALIAIVGACIAIGAAVARMAA